jgi:predicted unusual protein kinase regulating ubiquinone biosynthesis (AarF/ABC1/UbiB family)
MAISLKPENLRRYKDIAVLLVKHARSDLVENAGPEATLDVTDPTDSTDPASDPLAAAKADAEQLAGDLERMGPTFVKLGQLLSTRADFLPGPYIDALSRLQDQLEPFPFEQVEEIVTAELGVKLSSAFADFDREPLAVASLGQVHRATLRSRRLVAVKVQRPGIRETIAQDLEALREIAGLVDRRTEVGRRFGFGEMLDEFAKSLVSELDYRVEASNLELLAANLKDHPRILVPAPVRDYTTGRVLTMEFVSGKKVTALGPLARLELDGSDLADALFGAYLDQILRDGFFHADPHPGNVFVTDDGRIALIDLGMVARVAPEAQARLVKLLLALSDGRGEETADGLVELGEDIEGAEFDEGTFRRRVADLVGRHQGTTLAGLDTGRVVLELVRTCGECGLRPPPELTLLGKALLNLDLVARTLDPDFDPNRALRAHAGDLLKAHLLHSSSPGHLLSTALEAKELIERMPGRLNRVLDAVAKGELSVKVDAIDEAELMRGFQKIANRVTLGLVIAALIMGAAMVMRVPSSVQLFGYPALAVVLFVLAAGAGLALAVTIVVSDRRPHR